MPKSTSSTNTSTKRPVVAPSSAPVPAGESVTRVTIELPTHLAKHYEEQGEAWDRTLEHEIVERLSRCRNHVSMAPLYFTDDQRRELENALSHNCSNPDVVLGQIKHAVLLKVGDVSVDLDPKLQQRLRSRVFRGENYEQVLKREVIKGLRKFTGLDPQ